MDNSYYKARLFEIMMASKGLTYVMNACADLLHNPFVFVNRSLQLICQSSECAQYPKIFSWIEDENGRQLQVAHEADNAGYFRAIYGGDAPVYGTVSSVPAKWVAARVRLRNQILGNILVPDCCSPFTEEYQEMLPLICQTIAFTLKQSDNNDSSSLNYESMLIRLLNGEKTSHQGESVIRDRLRLLGYRLPEEMRLLIVRRSGSENKMSQAFLEAQLHSQFPMSHGIIYKNDCLRILDVKRNSEDKIKDGIFRYWNTDQLVFGISRPFSNPEFLHDAYLQADAAVRLGSSMQISLHQFDDILGMYLLEQAEAANNMSEKGIIMEEIRNLLDTITDGGNEKIQDLAVFLSCGRNVTKSAEMRGIHKNSMYYRLNRIEELTGLNLNDDDVCIQLILSLALLGYLPLCDSSKTN